MPRPCLAGILLFSFNPNAPENVVSPNRHRVNTLDAAKAEFHWLNQKGKSGWKKYRSAASKGRPNGANRIRRREWRTFLAGVAALKAAALWRSSGRTRLPRSKKARSDTGEMEMDLQDQKRPGILIPAIPGMPPERFFIWLASSSSTRREASFTAARTRSCSIS